MISKHFIYTLSVFIQHIRLYNSYTTSIYLKLSYCRSSRVNYEKRMKMILIFKCAQRYLSSLFALIDIFFKYLNSKSKKYLLFNQTFSFLSDDIFQKRGTKEEPFWHKKSYKEEPLKWFTSALVKTINQQ